MFIRSKDGIVSESVLAHGIDHHVEHLAGFNQFIDKVPCVLYVHIIIISAVNEEQASMQIFGIVYKGGLFISFRVETVRWP